MSRRTPRTRPGPSRPTGARPVADRPRHGFTLIELLVVMVIIGILLGFILNASMNAVRSGQERATQALITKLEQGLNDRLFSLMQNRPEPNQAHVALATINSGNLALSGYLRAQTIAWYDYVKREMPDTFYRQNNGDYPLNFAATPYPVPLNAGSSTDPALYGHYILPLGNSISSNTVPSMGDGSGSGYSYSSVGGLSEYNPTGEGIFGASYAAASGIYKNLGYLPTGYDTVDNNHNGKVDEYAEGVNSTNQALVQAHLQNHKHVTARAETLYALLVEGNGPLGSVFNADEFTDKEVQDTDEDGLPEFVDAWGNPLQFFRWPILYHSDLQRGQVFQPNDGATTWQLAPPYATPLQPTMGMLLQREQDPMDLNQQLVAPAWWYNGSGANSGPIYSGYASYTNDSGLGISESAQAFEFYFHRLTEPYPVPDPNKIYTAGNYWDRSGSTYGYRRAYYSKFLVLSAGPDGQFGVFLYASDADFTGMQFPAWALIANENCALPFSVFDFHDFTKSPTYSSTSITYADSPDTVHPSSGELLQAAQDDISNQNIQTTVPIGGGG